MRLLPEQETMQCSGLLCQTVTVAAEKCKYLESLVGAGAPGRPGLVGGGRVTVAVASPPPPATFPWHYGAQTAVLTTFTLLTQGWALMRKC